MRRGHLNPKRILFRSQGCTAGGLTLQSKVWNMLERLQPLETEQQHARVDLFGAVTTAIVAAAAAGDIEAVSSRSET